MCKDCKAKLETLRADSYQSDHKIIAGTKSCYQYNDMTKKAILPYKYNRKMFLQYYIALEIADLIKKENITADFITYVPLNFIKHLFRGFNQSALIAQHVSKLTDIPFKITLVRTINTPQQAGLNREMREHNVKNAFDLKKTENFSGKSAIIIDDIITTGATLKACSKKLKECGIENIIPVTFASTKL